MCDGSRAFLHEGRQVHWDQMIAELKFKMLEFGCYLTDSNESWKVFDQVMGNLGQTGCGSFLGRVSEQRVSRYRGRWIPKTRSRFSLSRLLWKMMSRRSTGRLEENKCSLLQL